LKKIILILLSLTTFAAAQSQIYTGFGYGYFNTDMKNADTDTKESITANAARFKIGYGSREAYAVEFSLDYIDSNPKRYGFDIALIKSYDFDIYVNPFAKVGFGAGILDNRESTAQSLRYGSFNLGGGLYVPLGEHSDIELSYEYKNISYQREESQNSNATGNTNNLYIGFNIRY